VLANNKVIEEKVLNISKQIVAAKAKKFTEYVLPLHLQFSFPLSPLFPSSSESINCLFSNQLKTSSQMSAAVDKFMKESLAQFEDSASYARESSSYPAWTLLFTVYISFYFFDLL
jgi:hypothetical protein